MAIAEAAVVPVTDPLITAVAEMRAACRQVGHLLADRIHANDLWIAASAVHIAAALVSVDSIFEVARSRPRAIVPTSRVVIDSLHARSNTVVGVEVVRPVTATASTGGL
jgi:hypothetical protein